MMKQSLSAILMILASAIVRTSEADHYSLNRQELAIGPQWDYVYRLKEGGTKQRGDVVGIRARYDRFKCFGVYWGGESGYTQGRIHGHTRSGVEISSRLSDFFVEGRLGFTFQQKIGFQASITPFVGLGYFQETNKFVDPSPIPIHFKTRFTYVALGFISWVHFTECFEAGLKFQVQQPFAPKCKATNDPDNDAVEQRIGERMQYKVELPITYRICRSGKMALSLSPFFEYRNYGGHANFPFDFIDTHYETWGVNLEYIYRL
jgi:hypothetical protein